MFLFWFIFFLGLIIGSFLNILIDRLPQGRSILGRSSCDSCKKVLSWVDLIPVLSFVYLRGKCSYCKTKLSFYYPFVELVTGSLFVFTLAFHPWGGYILAPADLLSLAYSLFVVSMMIVIFFADLKYGIIPDKILFPAILVSLVWIATSHQQLAISYLLSATGAFAFMLFLFTLTRGKGMGFGDVKFAFLMGLILGFPAIVISLYAAFLTGAAAAIILVLWKKKGLKSAISFGPFLVFGTLISLFFEKQIISIISQLI